MLDDKTTLNLVYLITVIGTVLAQLINVWRSPKKQDIVDLQGITQIIRDKAEHAIRQNDEIKVQTNSHYSELEKKLDHTEVENKVLRERLIALAQLIPSPVQNGAAQEALKETKEELKDLKQEIKQDASSS